MFQRVKLCTITIQYKIKRQLDICMVVAKVVLIGHGIVCRNLNSVICHTYCCNYILFDPGSLRIRQDLVHGVVGMMAEITQLIQLLQQWIQTVQGRAGLDKFSIFKILQV